MFLFIEGLQYHIAGLLILSIARCVSRLPVHVGLSLDIQTPSEKVDFNPVENTLSSYLLGCRKGFFATVHAVFFATARFFCGGKPCFLLREGFLRR